MNDRHSTLRRVPVVVLCGVLLAGCSLFGGDDEPTPKPSGEVLPAVAWDGVKASGVDDGGTLRLAVDALPENFNPEHASNTGSDISRLLSPTVGSAVRVTADGGWEVDTDYARSVEIVDRKPLTIRVRLNPKAVWQGGTPVTADDMVAYVKAHDGSRTSFEIGSTEGFDDIASVDPSDDGESYRVTFERPVTDWPRYVYPGLPANVSRSPRLFNRYFTKRSISSNGPFVVTELDRDRGRVVMERNPRWWGRTPKLSRIVWQAATPKVQLEAVRAGELDLVQVPAALQRSAREDLGDGQRYEVAAGTEWTQLTMNGARGPLRSVAVRRAIAAALDRTALARLSSSAAGVPASVMGSFVFVPGQRGYTDQSDAVPHGAQRAEALLDDAGWTIESGASVRTRKGKKLTLVMPVPADTPTSRQRASLIADQLGQVGIQVELQDVPDDDYFTSRVVPLDFDLATFTHTGSAFPIVDTKALFYPIDSSQNFTGVEDRELAGAWDKGVEALDDDERRRVVRVLDERLFRDVPIVPLGIVPEVSVVGDDVVNIGASQFLAPDWTVVGFRAPSGD